MSDTSTNSTPEPADAAAGALDLVTRAARDGAADAREAANRAWDNAGRFLTRFVYTTCYTVSYGVVFPTVLLARSIPRDNAAVRGLIDGAHDATRKAEEVVRPAVGTDGGIPVTVLATT